ncbi:MAG: RsmE family RNA methyltransferase, partial [Thermoanaerobaculia bacterium]
RIHFISAEREARAFESSQIARLHRVSISAVEQSGRSRVPDIVRAGSVGEASAAARAEGLAIAVLDAEGSAPDRAAGAAGRFGLFIGPEGGWSAQERELFRRREIPAWSLGPTVLRVETAAVVAAGLVLCGDGLPR